MDLASYLILGIIAVFGIALIAGSSYAINKNKKRREQREREERK